jgi:hypothetical protein
VSEVKREIVARVTGQQYVPSRTVELNVDQKVVSATAVVVEAPSEEYSKVTVEQVRESLEQSMPFMLNIDKYFNSVIRAAAGHDVNDSNPNAAHLYDSDLDGSFDAVSQLESVNEYGGPIPLEDLATGGTLPASETFYAAPEVVGTVTAPAAPVSYINVAEAVRRFKEITPAETSYGEMSVIEAKDNPARPTLDDLRRERNEEIPGDRQAVLDAVRALLKSSGEIQNTAATLLERVK